MTNAEFIRSALAKELNDFLDAIRGDRASFEFNLSKDGKYITLDLADLDNPNIEYQFRLVSRYNDATQTEEQL
jgi:hypothetical protein